jgi:hypothetical protein
MRTEMTRMTMLGVWLAAGAAFAQAPEVTAAVEEPARFRAGLSVASGTFVGGLTPELSVAARAGAQLTRRWALLGELGVTYGWPREAGTLLGFGHAAVLGEATFADRYFVGAGPVLAYGVWSAPSGATSASAAAGLFPGLDLRLGVGFGSRSDSGRRHQLTLGLDFKLLYSGSTVSATNASSPAHVGPGVGGSLVVFVGYEAK